MIKQNSRNTVTDTDNGESYEVLKSKASLLIGTNAGLLNIAQKYGETIDSLRAELVTAQQECIDARSQMKDNSANYCDEIARLEAESIKLLRHKRAILCIYCGSHVVTDWMDAGVEAACKILKEHDLECTAHPLRVELTALRKLLNKEMEEYQSCSAELKALREAAEAVVELEYVVTARKEDAYKWEDVMNTLETVLKGTEDGKNRI